MNYDKILSYVVNLMSVKKDILLCGDSDCSEALHSLTSLPFLPKFLEIKVLQLFITTLCIIWSL